MATIEPSLFDWRDVEARSDLDRFDLARDHLPDARLLQYLEVMRGSGRDDYPVAAMWNALIAGVVFQHPSVEALLRELGRNPALLQACGFAVFTDPAQTRHAVGARSGNRTSAAGARGAGRSTGGGAHQLELLAFSVQRH